MHLFLGHSGRICPISWGCMSKGDSSWDSGSRGRVPGVAPHSRLGAASPTQGRRGVQADSASQKRKTGRFSGCVSWEERRPTLLLESLRGEPRMENSAPPKGLRNQTPPSCSCPHNVSFTVAHALCGGRGSQLLCSEHLLETSLKTTGSTALCLQMGNSEGRLGARRMRTRRFIGYSFGSFSRTPV